MRVRWVGDAVDGCPTSPPPRSIRHQQDRGCLGQAGLVPLYVYMSHKHHRIYYNLYADSVLRQTNTCACKHVSKHTNSNTKHTQTRSNNQCPGNNSSLCLLFRADDQVIRNVSIINMGRGNEVRKEMSLFAGGIAFEIGIVPW